MPADAAQQLDARLEAYERQTKHQLIVWIGKSTEGDSIDTAPRRILSFGGRFAFDDAGETPNTQVTVFDYAGAPLILENRVLPAKPGVQYMDHRHGVRQGVVVQCENGYYAGRYGGEAVDAKAAFRPVATAQAARDDGLGFLRRAPRLIRIAHDIS